MRIAKYIEKLANDYGGHNKVELTKKLYYFAQSIERATKKKILRELGRDYKKEPDLIPQAKINKLEKETFDQITDMQKAHQLIAETLNCNLNLELNTRVYRMIHALPKNIEFDINIMPEPIKTEFITQSLSNENIQYNKEFTLFWLQK